MKKLPIYALGFLICSLFFIPAGFALAGGLQLTLTRDWGYGFGGDIQGLFSMHASGPDGLVKVEFYIDDLKIGEDTAAPYAVQFTTDDYPLGTHTFSALGLMASGEMLRSNSITANFVPPQEVSKFLLPVLGVVVLVIVASSLGPMLINRGKFIELPAGAERKYGLGGGGICPRCRRPFALPFFGMNLGRSKLGRCPYCGKIGAVRLLPMSKLREAEQAELTWAQRGATQGTREAIERKEIEDSKYQDL